MRMGSPSFPLRPRIPERFANIFEGWFGHVEWMEKNETVSRAPPAWQSIFIRSSDTGQENFSQRISRGEAAGGAETGGAPDQN
jgi:hypothetical protein